MAEELTKKYFASDAEVKWCPGCGDYAIMNAVRSGMVEAGKPRDEVAIVSGIGCSSRFPYYMETYGFHTIHGRAAAVASGMKVGNPDLDVWVISGDGDSTAIGGNHFIHTARRNVDLNYVLINNKVYGLTKGQYSPTSDYGQITKTSPYGVIDYPMLPLQVALGCNGSFVSRSLDKNMKLTEEIMKRGVKHKGFSLMEVYANCVIYADGAHDRLSGDEGKMNTIICRHGEKLLFGKENEYCLVREGLGIKAAKVSDVSEQDILVHDEKDYNLAYQLSHMAPVHGLPIAFGVLYCEENKKSYEDLVYEQADNVKKKMKGRTLDDLLSSGHTWTVE